MPQYPNSIPVMSTVNASSTDPMLKYPHARHINSIFREMEGITRVLGTNPRLVDDSISPSPNPETVAEYIDMLANIFKNISGRVTWDQAALPLRQLTGGHGTGATIGAGSTSFFQLCARGLNATEAQVKMPVPYPAKVLNIRMVPLTAQSTTGALTVTLRKNAANTSLSFVIAAGSSSIGSSTGSVSFAAGDLMSISAVNAASVNSCQIGSWTIEMDQAG